jgi:hypothetical protein
MGHITVLDEDPLQALDRARLARRRLSLRAKAVEAPGFLTRSPEPNPKMPPIASLRQWRGVTA